MDTEAIRQLIEAGLPGSSATVSGADGVHFDAIVVSESFAGKSTLQRHRLVYATLGSRMGHEIHALSLRTVTPDEAS
jgi:acid stress-induced BolA-like protein IbaG/YrbA